MLEDFLTWVNGLEYWGWWILAVILIILEVFAPSTLFLWLGVSAGVVGIVAWIFPEVPWEYEWTLFAIVSVSSIILSRLFFKKNPGVVDNQTLNRRGVQYIGRQFVLTEAIRNGRGKIHVDDTQWAVEGPDMELGEDVVVTDTDGTLLIVEPKH